LLKLLQLYFSLPVTLAHTLHAPAKITQLISMITLILNPLFTAALIFIIYLAVQWIVSPVIDIISMRFASSRPNSQNDLFEMTFPEYSANEAYHIHKLYDLIQDLSNNSGRFSLKLKRKKTYSLELIGRPNVPIRYLVGIPQNDVELVTKALKRGISGLALTKVGSQSLSNDTSYHYAVSELFLKSDFTLPLTDTTSLKQHDPLFYLTGQISKLRPGEFAAFQIILSPIRPLTHLRVTRRIHRLKRRIAAKRPVSPTIKGIAGIPQQVLKAIQVVCLLILKIALSLLLLIPRILFKSRYRLPLKRRSNLKAPLNVYEQELADNVMDKLSQPLFEASLRLVVGDKTSLAEAHNRIKYLTRPFESFSSTYQTLKPRILIPGSSKRRMRRFTEHLQTHQLMRLNPVLSSSELSGLFHFPATPPSPPKIKTETSKTAQIFEPETSQKPGYDTYLGDKIYDDRFDPIGRTLNWKHGENTGNENSRAYANHPSVIASGIRLDENPKKQLELSFGEIISKSSDD
jgi:hypothetical protein